VANVPAPRLGSLRLSYAEKLWWKGWEWGQTSQEPPEEDEVEIDNPHMLEGYRAGRDMRVEGIEYLVPVPAISFALQIESNRR
jgi:hypothetical protein